MLELECVWHSHATLLARVPGTERVGRTVRFVSSDFRQIFVMLVADKFYDTD